MIALALIVLYILACVAVLVWIGRVKRHTPIVYYRCGACKRRMATPEAWTAHHCAGRS